jgi:hypothetical protein
MTTKYVLTTFVKTSSLPTQELVQTTTTSKALHFHTHDTNMTTSLYCDVYEGEEGLSSFAFEMEMEYETDDASCCSVRAASVHSEASTDDVASACSSAASSYSSSSVICSPALATSSSSLLSSSDVADSDYDHAAARSALAAWVDTMPKSPEFVTPPCRPAYLRAGARF